MAGNYKTPIKKAPYTLAGIQGWYVGKGALPLESYKKTIKGTITFLSKHEITYCKGLLLEGVPLPYSYVEGHSSIASVDNIELILLFSANKPSFASMSDLVAQVNGGIKNGSDLYLIDEVMYRKFKKAEVPAPNKGSTVTKSTRPDPSGVTLPMKGVPNNGRRRFDKVKPTFWKKH